VSGLRASSFEIYQIEGARISDELSFYEELQRSLSFPEHFGKNLDALRDCIGDLPARIGPKAALLWIDADRMWRTVPVLFLEAVFRLFAIMEATDPGQIELVLFGRDPGFQSIHLNAS
jgi:RNAse (barnase) inhibitor barstar